MAAGQAQALPLWAKLLCVVPAGPPFRPRLTERVVRYANQVLSRQLPDGLFEGRNRMYFGYRDLVPGLFEAARALPPPLQRPWSRPWSP